MSLRLQAFLLLIADCEGTAGPEGYRALYGWRPGRTDRLIDSFADHPRRKFHFDGREILPPERAIPYQYTTAAGKYQATESTWNDYIRAQGPHDFSPTSQDKFAVWRIGIVPGALAAIEAGDLDKALRLLSPVWESFPYSDGKFKRTFAYCEAKYGAHLDQLQNRIPPPLEPIIIGEAAAPKPPPEEDDMSADNGSTLGTIGSFATNAAPIAGAFNPVAGLAMGLVGSLISAFSPLAKEKIAKEINRHSDNPQVGNMVADSILQTAQRLTQKADPIEAVVAARASPEIMLQIEGAAVAKLDELAPMLDKLHQYDKDAWAAEERSREAAAERAGKESNEFTMALVISGLGMVGLLVLFLCFIIGWQVIRDGNATVESWAQFTGIIGWATGVVSGIFLYRFGSTRSSNAKDTTIAEMAARRPR